MTRLADADQLIMSKTGTPIYGSSDGIAVVKDAAGEATAHDGVVAVAGGVISRTLDPLKYCEVFEDFVGFCVFPDADSSDLAQGPWAHQNAGTSNTPARVDDADNGVFKLLCSNTSEVGDITLYWGDQQNIDSDAGAVLITRVKIGVLPAAADSICWGFASARNAIQDSVANNAWFKVAGASLALKLEADNATTDSDDKAATLLDGTAITMAADTFCDFKVSMSPVDGASPIDVRFFYKATTSDEWLRVISGTTVFKYGADIATQPYFQVEKTTGTSTPDLSIDLAQVYWKRAS